jgi:predicted enzyme related to lactoylglutathione lyase
MRSTAKFTFVILSNPEFRLSQIGQIAITVRDVARATAFYRGRLGMTHLDLVAYMEYLTACLGVG